MRRYGNEFHFRICILWCFSFENHFKSSIHQLAIHPSPLINLNIEIFLKSWSQFISQNKLGANGGGKWYTHTWKRCSDKLTLWFIKLKTFKLKVNFIYFHRPMIDVEHCKADNIRAIRTRFLKPIFANKISKGLESRLLMSDSIVCNRYIELILGR